MGIAKTPLNKDVNPCLKCGTKGILAGHCGYTTFNPGEARCSNEKCGKIVKTEICDMHFPYRSIRDAWNEANLKYTVKIKRIENEIADLKKEKDRLKKLFTKNKRKN